jgi:DNA-binding NarL/FixJ family response regulator
MRHRRVFRCAGRPVAACLRNMDPGAGTGGDHVRTSSEDAPTLRVVVGEDNYLASEGIASVIERAEGLEVVGTRGDLQSLLDLIEEERPDVVLTDIRMPPTNTDEGIVLASELRTRAPEIGVVILSQYNDPVYAAALFETGSERRAYLLKESVRDVGELGRAVRAVAEGGSVVDPAVVETLLRAHRERERSHLDALTPRELEILALIAEGRSNAAIARALVLSKRAVERHINGVFMKLDLGDPENVSRRVKAALIYLANESG